MHCAVSANSGNRRLQVTVQEHARYVYLPITFISPSFVTKTVLLPAPKKLRYFSSLLAHICISVSQAEKQAGLSGTVLTHRTLM